MIFTSALCAKTICAENHNTYKGGGVNNKLQIIKNKCIILAVTFEDAWQGSVIFFFSWKAKNHTLLVKNKKGMVAKCYSVTTNSAHTIWRVLG